MANTLEIKKLSATSVSAADICRVLDEAHIGFVAVGNHCWAEAFPYRPTMEVRMAHNGKQLLINYRVTEECVRAVAPHDDGNVWEDSCCELFLSPVADGTGFFGQIAGMPIAAGNLFIGSFDVSNAMSNPLKATKFGLPFRHVPTYLAGYYKYKAGETFTVAGKPVSGRKDMCDIYGVFYETDANLNSLDGTNIFTDPHIISVARISDAKETDDWTLFNLTFVNKPGKEVDLEKLQNDGYNLAIVFASSVKGDLFEGAVGSTLYIDEVELSYMH